MLPLFNDEQVVTQSNEGRVILTTHRICLENKEWGNSYNQNIMLEHVTSCENRYKSQVWLLILAGLCVVWGLLNASHRGGSEFGMTVLVGLVLAGVYWITRKNSVIISSPSTKMYINVTGMGRDRVLDFINKVEQTKHKRIASLNNRASLVG